MAQQIIDTTLGLGDFLKPAGDKINANFAELYSDRYANTIPKIGFVGDSIMTALHLTESRSGIVQALLDQPRHLFWDQSNAGALAISGSSSGSTAATDLLGSTQLPAHLAYGADIEFGLVGGNDNGGAATYSVLNNIQTYINAVWAVKPSTKFAWHIP
ncbi:MAG TPA: hypothetical protein VF637_00280, partial [Sphingomicrobium sp.]